MFEDQRFIVYEYDKIPLNRDCYLLSAADIKEYENYCLGIKKRLDAYVTYIAIRQIEENSLEISWYPNIHDRFHEVRIKLPKEKIVFCVQDDATKPHIFVTEEWINLLYQNHYSIFVMIDTIDMKKALASNKISDTKLINLRDSIDYLSENYQNILFISFADNLLLKCNWTVTDLQNNRHYTYKPEELFKVFEKIKFIYNDILNLDIYGVFTQGSNEYYEESLHHVSKSKNHICINSLGTAFAELLSINEAACHAIRNGDHFGAELYLDELLFRSIRFQFKFDKNKIENYPYHTKFNDHKKYYLLNLNEIINNLRD